MKDLNYQLSKICRDNRDGGFSTQATRSRVLDLIASQLQELGFRRMQPEIIEAQTCECPGRPLAGPGHQCWHAEESLISASLVGEEGE